MNTYTRVIVERRGGPETLRVVQEPLREPGRGEIRVRMIASGVSFADIFMREGFHPEALLRSFPFTPGWEVVGRVDTLGAGASGFAPGDIVAAMPIVGGYSEFVFVAPEELVPVPPEVDPIEAVCLPLNYVTASLAKHHILSSLGVTPIDYRSVDFAAECLTHEPDGLDAVFDGIGGMHLLRSLRVLRREGRLVAYGLGSTSV